MASASQLSLSDSGNQGNTGAPAAAVHGSAIHVAGHAAHGEPKSARALRRAAFEQLPFAWAQHPGVAVFALNAHTQVLFANAKVGQWLPVEPAIAQGMRLHAVMHPGCRSRSCYLQSLMRAFAVRAGRSGEPSEHVVADKFLGRRMRVRLQHARRDVSSGGMHFIAGFQDASRPLGENVDTGISVSGKTLDFAGHSLDREAELAAGSIFTSPTTSGRHGVASDVLELERIRIARELHDSIGATLSSVKYGLEYALARLRGDERSDASEILDGAVAGVRTTMSELQSITSSLMNRDTARPDVLASLALYCATFERLHPDVSLEYRCEVQGRDVPKTVRAHLLPLVMEPMCNAVKHGKATRIRVVIARSDKDLRLTVHDNGCGFGDLANAVTSSGLGMSSIRERAWSSGGVLTISSSKSEGTNVGVSWPAPRKGSRLENV